MDHEALLSRPGIGEPDMNFIWGSTFNAPIGISFISENVFFNLILPKGSENIADKRMFLNRVEAKLYDEVWQVRRSMDQIWGAYGPLLKAVISEAKSLTINDSYVDRGRVYVHFVFNGAELPYISQQLLLSINEESNIHVEYLREMNEGHTVFGVNDKKDEYTAVSVEISYKEEKCTGIERIDEMFFVMGNFLDKGVKTFGKKLNEGIPEILQPERVSDLDNNLVSFYTNNQLIINLVELLSLEFILLHGFYGSASRIAINLTMNVPTQQTQSLLRILNKVMNWSELWRLQLSEVVSSSQLRKCESEN
ncbi:MAG: hypothetical protein ACYCT2_01510 [Thermoplasmataceae archaeon]